jgi:translation initiation factor 1 (eIF-1/SUI1)
MARQIDWTQPLSDEDRIWAAQRMDMAAGNGMTIGQRIEQNDIEHGKAAKDAKKSRAERMSDLRTIIADATNELARLQQEQIDEDNVNKALTGDFSTGGTIVDNTHVDGQKPEGASDAVETYEDKRWTVSVLQSEIDKRNEERAEAKLPPLNRTGTKSELVERLMEDDREIAADNAE